MNLTNHQILTTNEGVIATLCMQRGEVSPNPTGRGLMARDAAPLRAGALAHDRDPPARRRQPPDPRPYRGRGRRSVGPWTAPRHERPIAPPRPRTKGVKPAAPPPADIIPPARFEPRAEPHPAAIVNTYTVQISDPTHSIEMPRGDQW